MFGEQRGWVWSQRVRGVLEQGCRGAGGGWVDRRLDQAETKNIKVIGQGNGWEVAVRSDKVGPAWPETLHPCSPWGPPCQLYSTRSCVASFAPLLCELKAQ